MAQTDIGTTVSGYDFSQAGANRTPYGFESGGVRYAFLCANGFASPTGDHKVHAFKQVETGGVEMDAANAPDIGSVSGWTNCYTVCPDGNTVYVLYVRAHASGGNVVIDGLTVIAFDLLSETWGASTNYAAPVVDFIKRDAAGSREVQVNLVRRGTGDMILYYSGPTEISGGSGQPLGRAYCATFDGAVFGAATELPGQVGTDRYFWPTGAVCDSGGITRFFMLNNQVLGSQDVIQVAMNAGGVFGTPEVATSQNFLNGSVNSSSISAPIVWSVGGTEYVGFAGALTDPLPATTASEQLFYAPTVAGTVALTWAAPSVIAQGADDGTDPNVLNDQTFIMQPICLSLAFVSDSLVASWTFSTGGTNAGGDGFIYSSVASFPALSWSAAAITIQTSIPALSACQVSSFPVAGGVGVIVAQCSVDDDSEVAQYNRVDVAAPADLSISCNNPPNAQVGAPYNHPLSATGGNPPYTFSLTGGALPLGLTLTALGVIIGTPATSGAFSFTATVTDLDLNTASVTCSLTVNQASALVGGGRPRRASKNNNWDECLEGIRDRYRLICKKICPKPRAMTSWPWDPDEGIPPDAVPFRAMDAITTPAPAAGDVEVLSFRVPNGYDGLIMQGYNLYNGTGFVQGSGDIVWRLKLNHSYYVEDWGNVPFAYGSVRDPFPFSDALFLTSLQTVQMLVNVPNLSGSIQVGASQILGALMGYYLPR